MSGICPGQDMRFWGPGDIFEVACGQCGATLEFFKDEGRRKCRSCGNVVANPKLSMGCAKWCEHAKECLGFDPKEMAGDEAPEESLAERLTVAMKNVFKGDQARVNHALAVLDNAREILKDTEADPKVVLAAALLHDIGIKAALEKHGSAAGVFQEQEGPPIAERIMKELDLDKDTIEHVKRIVANHHSAKDIDTPEFRVIWDADWLVNLAEERPDNEKLRARINKVFKTETGAELARQKLLKAG